MLYVIMSVYRNDKVDEVKIAVDSILQQTYQNLKLCMMQDGPIDNEVERYLKALPDQRVRVYVREENKGLATSLNELLEIILKKDDVTYVARMDADDYSLPGRFEKQVQFLETHPDVDIIGSYITESSDPTQPGGHMVTYPLDHAGCRKVFSRRTPLAHPSVLFRRSFFDKAGLYPTDTLRFEDGALWLKGFLNGCHFANVPEVLVKMRVNDAFYNRRNSAEKTKLDLKYRKQVIDKLDLGKKEYLYAYARYLLFRYASPSILKWAYKHLRK